MTDPWVIAGIATATVGAAAVGYGAFTAVGERKRSSVTAYLSGFDDRADGDAEVHDEFAARLAQPFSERLVRPVLRRVAGLVGGVTSGEHRVRVRTKLAQAGLDQRFRPEEVIAAEVVGGVLGAVLGLAVIASGALAPGTSILCAILITLIGLGLPTVWLNNRVTERMEAIRADLPDVLDLLAISVEAGVGLEGALEVVTQRFRSPLAQELNRALQEMGLGLSRRDALINLRQRSLVPELSAFVGALVQADALGMPLGRVLKIQAVEMRSRRRQWARERAAKLPVKILLPLVFCIFPAVLVVVLGPASSQIGEALK